MNELFRLLEMKNFWFRKFLLLCERYVKALQDDADKAADDIEMFERNRDSLIKIIKGIDGKIKALLARPEYENQSLDSDQRTRVNFFMREKDSILNQILKIDREILQTIESLRDQQSAKLQQVSKGKRALSKYKSGAGKQRELDKQV